MGEDGNVPIRVLLADDHAMFRQSIVGILANYKSLEVVAEVPNDEDVLRLARELRPDVVVMQVQMPFERSLQTLRELRAFPAPPKVVICTVLESPRYVRDLAGVGASAYVVKTASVEHLIGALRAAVLDPNSESIVVGMPLSMLEVSEEVADGVLSARELEVLLLAARGLSNGQIASALHLAESTVKRHLASVYERMGVNSRGEAAREALLKDWITIEEIRAPAPGKDGSS